MRYFINVSDGRSVTEDRDGDVYDCEDAAWRAALDAARALIADSARQGRCRRHWRFDVLDESRSVLFRVDFVQALLPDMLPALPEHRS